VHALAGPCRLEREEGEELRPAGIAEALGQVLVLHQVADPQGVVRDHLVLADQSERRGMVEVAPLAAHLQLGLGEQLDRLAPAIAMAAPTSAARRAAPLAAAQIRLRRAVVR
jgi:hypothetical protein